GAQGRISLDAAAYLKAVYPGQAQIQQHEVRAHAPCDFQGTVPVDRVHHLMSHVLEQKHQHLHAVEVVLDHEHFLRSRALAHRDPPRFEWLNVTANGLQTHLSNVFKLSHG